MTSQNPVVEVVDLRVRYGDVAAVRGITFSLAKGESLAIVGESGSGKSSVALCLAGLVQPPRASGSVRLEGQELMGAAPETLRKLRWSTVALSLQGAPLNPVATVGAQVAEPLRDRLGLSRDEADTRARHLATEVMLDPATLDRYPHQLSGGERRRAALAAVLALDPTLVVLDEPTAGLDTVLRRELVHQIGALAGRRGFALVVISHDLADITELAARTMVLYAGEAMEVGLTGTVIQQPAHPYTWALVNAYPVMTTTKDLRPIRGRSPDPRAVPPGCPYNPRCTQTEAICWEDHPGLRESQGRMVACHFGGLKTLLAAEGVTKSYGRGRDAVLALDAASITVREGEAVGIIGASGSGKSTLGRILAGHLAPDRGRVLLEGAEVPVSWRSRHRALRRRIQLIMQDPADALSPRMTVAELVREPLDVMGAGTRDEQAAAVAGALDSVGLPSSGTFLEAHSHELSGGQLQRVALARALVARPKLLVADEPTSMLDASEQARMLVVLRERQIEMGLGLVLISHDMAVIRKVTDRIVVLDAGRVVEDGLSQDVSVAPVSTAARRLIEAAPRFDPVARSPWGA